VDTRYKHPSDLFFPPSLLTLYIPTGGIVVADVFFLDKIEKSVLNIVCFPADAADIFSVVIRLSRIGISFASDGICGTLFSSNFPTCQKRFSKMVGYMWQPASYGFISSSHL